MAKISAILCFEEMTATGERTVQEFQSVHLKRFEYSFGPTPFTAVVKSKSPEDFGLLSDLAVKVHGQEHA